MVWCALFSTYVWSVRGYNLFYLCNHKSNWYRSRKSIVQLKSAANIVINLSKLCLALCTVCISYSHGACGIRTYRKIVMEIKVSEMFLWKFSF